MKSASRLLCFLLALSSQASWCVADGLSTKSDVYQVQELHATEGKKPLEILQPRKLGHAQIHWHHQVNTLERHRIHRRMAIGHKGGGVGGGTGSVGGRNTGGGAAEARPLNKKSGAVSLPVPRMSILTLVFACGVFLLFFSF